MTKAIPALAASLARRNRSIPLIRAPAAGRARSWNAGSTPSRTDDPMEYVLGFLIAVAVGLTGVGGGSLTVPLLILLLGVPAPEAVGTSLLFVTFTKLLA